MAKSSGLGRVFKETTPDKHKPKVLNSKGNLVYQRRELPGYYIAWRDENGRHHKERGADTQAKARSLLEARLMAMREARNSNAKRGPEGNEGGVTNGEK